MPYIKTSTNINIDDIKLSNIKSKMGEAIRLMGKSEDWLMLEFNDNAKMYFKGNKVKLEVGIGKGKKLFDKREDMAKKDAEMKIKRALKNQI